MKYLVLFCAFTFTGVTGAQIGLMDFPYNPDFNGDNWIGSSDLTQLLSEYGQVFNPQHLILNEDTTLALFDVGDYSYIECLAVCDGLPSNWRLANLTELGYLFLDSDLGTIDSFQDWSDLWFDLSRSGQFREYPIAAYIDAETSGSPAQLTGGSFGETQYLWYNPVFLGSSQRRCICAQRQNRKITISSCLIEQDFEDCITQKASEGWYPLESSISNTMFFWKYAD